MLTYLLVLLYAAPAAHLAPDASSLQHRSAMVTSFKRQVVPTAAAAGWRIPVPPNLYAAMSAASRSSLKAKYGFDDGIVLTYSRMR